MSSPEKLVIQKLQEKNRPFSSITLGDELHNEIKQTQLKKILDQLANDNVISCKVSGKAKLYFPRQDTLTVASPEELEQYDERIDQLRETSNQLASRFEELKARRDKLLKTMPIDQLRQRRIDIENEVQDEEQKKDLLIKSAEGISPEDAVKSQEEFNKRCNQWRTRKNKCKEIVDILSESLDKKPFQVYEDLDLETDESLGLKLEFKDKKYTILENNFA